MALHNHPTLRAPLQWRGIAFVPSLLCPSPKVPKASLGGEVAHSADYVMIIGWRVSTTEEVLFLTPSVDFTQLKRFDIKTIPFVSFCACCGYFRFIYKN